MFSTKLGEMKNMINWEEVSKDLIKRIDRTVERLKSIKEERKIMSVTYKDLENIDEDARFCTLGYVAYPLGEILEKHGVVSRVPYEIPEEVWKLGDAIDRVLSEEAIKERREDGVCYKTPEGEYLLTFTIMDICLEKSL